ncbi:MAG: GAF domain-containing protein, partial [Chloroflexi bacterium]|nr:GAF domain-containing protein [Chloroflexota bacterium]
GATLLSIGFARRITRPLDDLRQGAIAIGQGDLDHVIQVRTGDEIEDLAHQFNQMAQELKSSQAEIRVHAQELEQRVADRTHDLERRATLLATAADMGRVAASILDPVQLTRQVVDLVGERFDLYYVGLFLVAAGPDGEYAVLDAGTGEPGRLMKEQGHRLLVGGTSMVGMACATGQARIALDVGQERVRFDNPHLPLTRSEIALPLIVGEHILGALDAQSTRPGAFSQEDIAVLQLVADQVAVAVENARIFSHEAGVLEATSPIYRASRRLTTALTTDEVSTAIIDSVAETGADGCVIVEFEFTSAGEPEALLYRGVWRRDRAPQFKPGLRLPISASPFPLDMVETFWTVADTEQDETLPESARQVFENTDARALVNIPLRAAGRTFGQVVVLRNTPGTFPDTDLRLYETLSGQASVALERARLLEETRRRADEETALRTISDRIAQAIDIDAVLYSAVEGLTQALHATGAYMDLGAVPAAEGLSREEP